MVRFVRERLTKKQKLICRKISGLNDDLTASQFVNQLSKELNCSKSTIWRNLNSLKRIGLVSFGDLENKGKPLELTKIGRFLAPQVAQRKSDRTDVEAVVYQKPVGSKFNSRLGDLGDKNE